MRDYNYADVNSWNAVAYKPRKNVVFRGFGIFANRNNKDFDCFVKWEIDGKESEEYKVSFVDAEKCEHKMFDFLLKDVGVRAIRVAKGSLIHVGIKFGEGDNNSRRSIAGYNGER